MSKSKRKGTSTAWHEYRRLVGVPDSNSVVTVVTFTAVDEDPSIVVESFVDTPPGAECGEEGRSSI